MALKQQGIARTLYDDTNLHALINLCSRRLQKPFEYRDIQFLRLYLQYCLLQHHAGVTPEFNPLQQRWAQSCAEYPLAEEIGRHWQRHVMQSAPPGESLFMALLFSMLRIPDPVRDNHQQDRRLRLATARLVLRFREYGNVRFSDEQGLNDQLYIHLAQALNRSVFAIGIDNTLPEEFQPTLSPSGSYYPRGDTWLRSGVRCAVFRRRDRAGRRYFRCLADAGEGFAREADYPADRQQ